MNRPGTGHQDSLIDQRFLRSSSTTAVLGASHQAVASGVPSIPVPISMDQPFWADRLHRLGVAARPLNPRKPSVEHLQQAIAQAEAEPVRLRAAQLAARMITEDGLREAVARLEELTSLGNR